MGAIPEKKQHIQILLDRAKKKKLSQKIIDSLAKQLQEFDDICEKKEFCKSKWGIKDIKANPKMFVSEKFNDRFDLSELLNGGANNENDVLYKLVDSHTDKTWFKTAEQLSTFKPPKFNKYEWMKEVSKKFGDDRFDFSKSIFLGAVDRMIIYDNYLLTTRESTRSDIMKSKIMPKPNRDAMVKNIIDLFGPDRYDTDKMVYLADHLPITIFDYKKKCKISIHWAQLKSQATRKKSHAVKGRNTYTVDEAFDILTSLYPDYAFDKNDLFVENKKSANNDRYVKYKDLSNGETYTYQEFSTLLLGKGRINKAARTEEDVINQMRIRLRNVDYSSIIFPKSTFNFETKYYLGALAEIKYKLNGGLVYYKIRVSTLFGKAGEGKCINSKKFTKNDVIKKFEEIDIYNNFDFKTIEFNEITDKFNTTKKFKVFDNTAKKFIFRSLLDIKMFYKRTPKKSLRLNNRTRYKYLDKSDTTKNGHVDVICPVHGLFSQWSHNHFYRGDCCPLCNASVGEIKMYQYFIDNNIKFIYKFKAHKAMDVDYLRFDFFLPDLNIYIQFNGEHHYETVKWSNSLTDEELDERLFQEMYHDELKFEYCEKNNYDYIVLHYSQRNEVEKYLEKGIQEISEKRKNKVDKVKENNGSINTRTDTRRVAEAC